MDNDKSGTIDFKEYKMVRFIIEGNSNMREIKQDFADLASYNSSISIKQFIMLFKEYFEDCVQILS